MPLPRPESPPLAAALRALAAATDRLLATIDAMTEADFAVPSLLPGWSRAHVLAHLALNSKGLTTALTKMDQPDRQPIYASDTRRDADIEHLAAQHPARIADRVAVGASMLAAHLGGGPAPEDALEAVGAAGATARLNADYTSATIRPFAEAASAAAASIASWSPTGSFERTPGGRHIAAVDVPYMRWREVEIHHADLDLGYRPRDWPAEFAAFLYAGAAFDRNGTASMTLRASDGPTLVLTARTGTSGAAGAAGTGSAAGAAGTGSAAGAGNGATDVIPSSTAPTVVTDSALEIVGSSADLAWWLIGRGDGDGLTASGPLPRLGPWVRR